MKPAATTVDCRTCILQPLPFGVSLTLERGRAHYFAEQFDAPSPLLITSEDVPVSNAMAVPEAADLEADAATPLSLIEQVIDCTMASVGQHDDFPAGMLAELATLLRDGTPRVNDRISELLRMPKADE